MFYFWHAWHVLHWSVNMERQEFHSPTAVHTEQTARHLLRVSRSVMFANGGAQLVEVQIASWKQIQSTEWKTIIRPYCTVPCLYLEQMIVECNCFWFWGLLLALLGMKVSDTLMFFSSIGARCSKSWSSSCISLTQKGRDLDSLKMLFAQPPICLGLFVTSWAWPHFKITGQVLRFNQVWEMKWCNCVWMFLL